MHRALALLSLALAWPFLPGAGCRAHHAAPITADVTGASSGAATPQVRYFVRDDRCGPTGAACVDRPELWAPLRGCQVSATAAPRRRGAVRVSGCTSYVGVDYRIDIMAFDDANGNGRLDRGERYGLWADGPLVRSDERDVGAVSIELGQTL